MDISISQAQNVILTMKYYTGAKEALASAPTTSTIPDDQKELAADDMSRPEVERLLSGNTSKLCGVSNKLSSAVVGVNEISGMSPISPQGELSLHWQHWLSLVATSGGVTSSQCWSLPEFIYSFRQEKGIKDFDQQTTQYLILCMMYFDKQMLQITTSRQHEVSYSWQSSLYSAWASSEEMLPTHPQLTWMSFMTSYVSSSYSSLVSCSSELCVCATLVVKNTCQTWPCHDSVYLTLIAMQPCIECPFIEFSLLIRMISSPSQEKF